MAADSPLSSLPPARRWRQQHYPMPSVVALIRRANDDGGEEAEPQYLLIRRQVDPYAGKWALVGGKWDFGETLAAMICREVWEETGLESRFVALRGLVNERLRPADEEGEGGHFLLFVCEVRPERGEAREQQEGPVSWFTETELAELVAARQIVPTDYLFIQRFGRSTRALPLYEAEMIVRTAGSLELAYFEGDSVIAGRLPPQ